ncbi:serine/threonine-protein kinase [Arenicella xantha]|uniref:Serine/threonine protein kinase n=1 Tax=Arenicella xantha TaxID=644221 RepID=A0A395JLE2_9GAMM|nr:serine/threonine-protein kinase [Arenicella xantha]RBP48557.1 serine/threonine protein kinase [Arenicella xantha]
MSKPNIRFGIREKLFFLILVGFGALILTTFWQIGVQAKLVSAQTIGQSLRQSSTVLDTKIESRFNSIREVARSVARDSRILPLVYESEVLTLQDQSQEFKNQLDFDILFFTDGSGNILARSDRPQAIGQNMAGKTHFFDDALAGKSGQGYFLSQGRLMQIVTEPIFDNVATDVVRGTVALAYEFSSDMANEIVSLTFSDIAFFSFTRDQSRQVNGVNNIYVTDHELKRSLSEYFEQSTSSWQPMFDGESAVQNFHTTLNNQEYFAVASRVGNDGSDPLGFVMILRSSADLLAPFTSIQNTVLVIGGICLVVAFMLAGFVSIRISRPIIELVSVTGGIRDGNFPDKSAAPKSNDEIGMLYRAVVEMGNTLKEKAELENYLAQISNELNVDKALSNSALEADLIVGGGAPEQHLPHSSGALVLDEGNVAAKAARSMITTGTRIGDRYDVLELIGQGAMGLVFLVEDRELDEKTALKLLPRDLFAESNAISIKEEIRLARRITHRNILRTFDMGNWDAYTYISMEYVAGYDLDVLLKRRGAQDLYIALLMGRQICSAMNAAHEEGVIHLDLKPGNMMVNQQGILKIMDFGLARSVANQEQLNSSKDNTKLMGTPRYMAPEQFLNEELDQRTDIYSIGIILYTLLTGSPPFSHADYMKLAEMHVHQELPEINGVDGVITGPLDQVIRKATEKDPVDRFQTVREMLEQLSNV